MKKKYEILFVIAFNFIFSLSAMEQDKAKKDFEKFSNETNGFMQIIGAMCVFQESTNTKKIVKELLNLNNSLVNENITEPTRNFINQFNESNIEVIKELEKNPFSLALYKFIPIYTSSISDFIEMLEQSADSSDAIINSRLKEYYANLGKLQIINNRTNKVIGSLMKTLPTEIANKFNCNQ